MPFRALGGHGPWHTEATKGALAGACKQAMEASKTALAAYGCEM